MSSQRTRVIQLYKTLSRLGKDYRLGHNYFRRKLQEVFTRHKNETDPKKIEVLIAHGEYIVKELEALQKLKRYKLLKRQYLLEKIRIQQSNILERQISNADVLKADKEAEKTKTENQTDKTSVDSNDSVSLMKNIHAHAKILQQSLEKVGEKFKRAENRKPLDRSEIVIESAKKSSESEQKTIANVDINIKINKEELALNEQSQIVDRLQRVNETDSMKSAEIKRAIESLKQKEGREAEEKIKSMQESQELNRQIADATRTFQIFDIYLETLSDSFRAEEEFYKALSITKKDKTKQYSDVNKEKNEEFPTLVANETNKAQSTQSKTAMNVEKSNQPKCGNRKCGEDNRENRGNREKKNKEDDSNDSPPNTLKVK